MIKVNPSNRNKTKSDFSVGQIQISYLTSIFTGRKIPNDINEFYNWYLSNSFQN